MDLKTKRIFYKASVNLAKLLFCGSIFVAFMITCMYIAVKVLDNVAFGFAAIAVPFLIYAVWDHSKSQVEREMEKEEHLVLTLSKNYER